MSFIARAVVLACSVAPSYAARSSVVNASAFVITSTGASRVLSTSSASITTTTKLNAAAANNHSSTTSPTNDMVVDPDYPGTAVERMMNARARVQQLVADQLDGEWEHVRRQILWAGGLRDLPNAIPGQGYTGHSFNDYNHVDLTCMNDMVSDNQNDGAVRGIAIGNRLGQGIRVASIEDLGPGGSWSTCANGSHLDPPQDVAHVQFRSRIAFKLVWAPTSAFDQFVLVDDEGKLLAHGKPKGALPSLQQRQLNYRLVKGSKYAVEADKIAKGVASE